MGQNVVDHRENSGSRRDVGNDALRICLRGFGTAQFRREPVGDLQHFRVDAADGSSHGTSVFPHAADHLAGIAAVAAVDVDEISALFESLMAELPRAVIVHAPQQENHLSDFSSRIVVRFPFSRFDQGHKLRERFNEIGNILRFHAQDGGVAFREHTGLVFAEVRFAQSSAGQGSSPRRDLRRR